MIKIIIVLSLITSALSCMNEYCIECQSYIFNFTVHETCKTCAKNFLVDDQGGCRVDVVKIATFIGTGVLILIGFLFLRRLLIAYNDKKEKIYTADFQEAVFDYMKQRNPAQTATERPYVPISERALTNNQNITQEQGIKICDLCKKGVQFGDKKVDSFCKCKHYYHSMCLKNHLTQKFKEQRGMLYGKCPVCKKKMQFISIYCQMCMQKHRDTQIREEDSLIFLYSFTCFRCKAIQKNKQRQELKICCNGLGQYLCCHCIRD